MIIGLGIDIASCERFRREDERFGDDFMLKIFNPDEIKLCRASRNPYEYFAAFFAVKEAAMKALGIGLADGASFLEITVDISDFVNVRVEGNMFSMAERKAVSKMHASFSCSGDIAVAVVVAEG